MTQRRSKRTAAVTKRRLLEEKLNRRKSDLERRRIRNLSRRELNVFDQEAERLNELVGRLLEESDSEFNESVDTLERTVNDIIGEIEKLGNLSTEESNVEEQVSTRRNTSTDDNILSEPVERDLVHFPTLSWPPRTPSQEPEDFVPLQASSLEKVEPPPTEENLDSEVFEEESEPELVDALTEHILGDQFKHLLRTDLRYSSSSSATAESDTSKMDEEIFKTRLRAVKLAERKLRNVKRVFTSKNVSDLDLDDYKSRLKEIRIHLDAYTDLVSELVLDLNPGSGDDQQRINDVEAEQGVLEQEVLSNENEVHKKVKDLLLSKPLTKAEEEDLNLKVKQMSINEEKERKSNEEKKKKLEVDKGDILEKVSTLKNKISKVVSVEDFSDQQIREFLYESKTWETKLDDIRAAKVKFDKDMISIGSDAADESELAESVMKISDLVKKKIDDLRSIDAERSLFSLSRTVKELAPYPQTFNGNRHENVYKFIKKMKEALTTNQIREKDKVDVLRKYLGGHAKTVIGDHYKTFKEATDRLLDHFGSPMNIWEGIKERLVRSCKKAQDWMKDGTKEKVSILAVALEFFREAEYLATEYSNELSSTIYSAPTVELVISILPREIRRKVCAEKVSKKPPKDAMKTIEAELIIEHDIALDENTYSKAVQESSAAFNACLNTFENPGQDRSSTPKLRNKAFDEHDCQKSGKCNTKWNGLGCALLYELATVKERREFLTEKWMCWCCGLDANDGRRKHTLNKPGGRPRYICNSIVLDVKCQNSLCTLGAALCSAHQPNNASKILKDWINSKKIRTTVCSIKSSPVNNNCSHNKDALAPTSVKLPGDVRAKLQKGDLSCLFDNKQLAKLFENDLKKAGVKNPKVDPVPDGEVAFMFCIVKGNKSAVQVFIDPGCNCAIMKDGIPQVQFKSCKLQSGPIGIDVATGISVNAEAEWGINLPLADGSHQAVRGLTVSKVTSDMPKLMLRKVFEKIKQSNKDFDHQNIKIPKELGGEVHMILGIQFNKLHPEPIFTMPNGLTVYKSKLLPANPNELACIGGPIEALDTLVVSAGAKSTIRVMGHLIRSISAGNIPRMEFFPSSSAEMERCKERFVDRDIPEIDDFLQFSDEETSDYNYRGNEESFDTQNEPTDEEAFDENNRKSELTSLGSFDTNRKPTCVEVFDVEDRESESTVNTNKMKRIKTTVGGAFDVKVNNENQSSEALNYDAVCSDCGGKVQFVHQSLTIQAELKRFFEHQEAGLDSSFRCIRCRDCQDCLKGAGQERMSMIQEAQQQLIKQSVSIDREKGRAVAKLPFLTDPAGKLNDNTRIAERRLESVCRKYAGDEDVKEMIQAGFKKLFDNGHMILLKDLPHDMQKKIKDANPSYTIPWDVAFKEGSLSTPARPVFDASSKTPGGESLNDLLAKGQPDLVRLLDMVLAWRMGPSALTGDIRQFYNSIMLLPEFWQFQKVLLKENMDPTGKTLIAIIMTLIYGVRPVGGQCEEVIKLIAEEIRQEHPEIYIMLILKRYVDDFAQSTMNKEETEKLKVKTTEALGSVKMLVKGWAESGKDPPDNLTEDGVSVGFAGKTWFPKGDFFKLNIQSLHFAKKKRGKFPADLVKFDKSRLTVEEYTPTKITRTNCTSVCARIYDTEGLLTPLTLKLKNDLRNLIKFEPSWNLSIPDHQRQIWVNNFKTIEEVRDILYLRCTIPTDAISCQARLLLLCDAADIGIILAAYVCYERPGGVWSCDLLFGKGVLAQDNWTIPQKELHGLSGLSNLKIILENALDGWIRGFFAFTDSEIAICWTVYERVKLTTFVRNRVINIRTKMGLDLLHHVDGKENPTDVGTRPELITSDSVRPGSIWMKGKPWMQMSIDKAKDLGIIKTVEDIKLSNDNKKVFKEGIVYDTFEEADPSIFAASKGASFDKQKLFQRQCYSKYLFCPLKRSFKSLVRITALVLVAVRKFKKLLLKKKIERGEAQKSALKTVDFEPSKFSVFNCNIVRKSSLALEPASSNPDTLPTCTKETLVTYFSIEGILVPEKKFEVNEDLKKKAWAVYKKPKKNNTLVEKTGRNPVTTFDEQKTPDELNIKEKSIKLTEDQLSGALEYLFRKASKEVMEFNDKKEVDRISVMHDGILFYNSRILEAAELKAVGHIADNINIESFVGINFKVPLVDAHSPLAHSIALHLHYVKFPHRGAETLHRASLQYCKILKGRKIFTLISQDCIYCKKLRKQLMTQMMGQLAECQITISPIFYFCLVDLWGPLKSYVPGYEKVTRSTADKPHEVYMMVFACCVTGAVNCQIIEGKKTGYCLDGFNRFFSEVAVPKIIYPDLEGGLIKALSEGEVDMVDLSGALSRQRGVKFIPVVPQGHSAHGRIEKRIHMLQESLERSEIRNSRCTATGWQTIGKLIERTVNSVPIGFYHHQSGGLNPLLRILTPNSLKLITTSDRAPAGLFTIPGNPLDIMENIQLKYEAWYHIWNEQYLPLIMDKQKWHDMKENLKPDDIVYFKLTESKMSATWIVGKVEEVVVGRDGKVREATISYKDTSSDEPEDWIHRTVNRPVRNLVKLFHLEDTSLIDDINEVHKLAEEVLKTDNISYESESFDLQETNVSDETKVKDEFFDDKPVRTVEGKPDDIINVADDESFDAQSIPNDTDDESFDTHTIPNDADDTTPTFVQDKPKPKKTRRKRKTEVEKLEIQMKGWQHASNPTPIQPGSDSSEDDEQVQRSFAIHSLIHALDEDSFRGYDENFAGQGVEEQTGKRDYCETFCEADYFDDNYTVYLL